MVEFAAFVAGVTVGALLARLLEWLVPDVR